MLFHLAVRYPILHPLRALLTGHWRAAPYAISLGRRLIEGPKQQ